MVGDHHRSGSLREVLSDQDHLRNELNVHGIEDDEELKLRIGCEWAQTERIVGIVDEAETVGRCASANVQKRTADVETNLWRRFEKAGADVCCAEVEMNVQKLSANAGTNAQKQFE